jgi:hypothetical protein
MSSFATFNLFLLFILISFINAYDEEQQQSGVQWLLPYYPTTNAKAKSSINRPFRSSKSNIHLICTIRIISDPFNILDTSLTGRNSNRQRVLSALIDEVDGPARSYIDEPSSPFNDDQYDDSNRITLPPNPPSLFDIGAGTYDGNIQPQQPQYPGHPAQLPYSGYPYEQIYQAPPYIQQPYIPPNNGGEYSGYSQQQYNQQQQPQQQQLQQVPQQQHYQQQQQQQQQVPQKPRNGAYYYSHYPYDRLPDTFRLYPNLIYRYPQNNPALTGAGGGSGCQSPAPCGHVNVPNVPCGGRSSGNNAPCG